MELMISPADLVLGSLLLLSLAANLALFVLFKRSKKIRPLSITAEELLHDLTRGVAIVRMELINQQDLFLRSPRT